MKIEHILGELVSLGIVAAQTAAAPQRPGQRNGNARQTPGSGKRTESHSRPKSFTRVSS
jgi:hypothetical protein